MREQKLSQLESNIGHFMVNFETIVELQHEVGSKLIKYPQYWILRYKKNIHLDTKTTIILCLEQKIC